MTIRGDGFLRGDALACRFEEEGDGGDGEAPPHPVIATTRARFVDARTIVCVAPPRHPRPRAPSDAATMAPCFAAAVSVSNDGASWSEPANAVRHLYCDVYVHPAARHVNPERAFGTPDRPFPNLQAAFSATLRDARLFSSREYDEYASLAYPNDRRHTARVGRPTPGVRSFGVATSRADAAAGGAYEGGVGAWTNVDVVRLAPGAYGGVGDVRLAVPTGRSFASSSGTDSGTNPTRSSRGANANARRSIVARRDTPRRCSRRRASDSAKPRRFPGRTGDSSAARW